LVLGLAGSYSFARTGRRFLPNLAFTARFFRFVYNFFAHAFLCGRRNASVHKAIFFDFDFAQNFAFFACWRCWRLWAFAIRTGHANLLLALTIGDCHFLFDLTFVFASLRRMDLRTWYADLVRAAAEIESSLRHGSFRAVSSWHQVTSLLFVFRTAAFRLFVLDALKANGFIFVRSFAPLRRAFVFLEIASLDPSLRGLVTLVADRDRRIVHLLASVRHATAIVFLELNGLALPIANLFVLLRTRLFDANFLIQTAS